MSGQSKRSWPSWLPDWLTRRLHVRKLRRDVREVDSHYRPLAAAETMWDKKQAIEAEWSFEAAWPANELAVLESARLRRLADRWDIDTPSSKPDRQTGHRYIPDEQRRKMRREIRDARRESTRWWIQVVVVPLIALVSSVTALIALLYRL